MEAHCTTDHCGGRARIARRPSHCSVSPASAAEEQAPAGRIALRHGTRLGRPSSWRGASARCGRAVDPAAPRTTPPALSATPAFSAGVLGDLSGPGAPTAPTFSAGVPGVPHAPGLPRGPDALRAGRPGPSARATRWPAPRLAEPFAVTRHVDLPLRRRAVALGQSAHGGLHPSSYTGRMQTTVRVSKENRDSL